MQIVVESRSVVARALRDFAERKVRFAMRRRTASVPRATVSLSDVNGPRGGVDKRCQVALKTDGIGTVVATATAPSWAAALHAALARATRLLERITTRRRGIRPALPGRRLAGG